jgi:hypothetical protein
LCVLEEQQQPAAEPQEALHRRAVGDLEVRHRAVGPGEVRRTACRELSANRLGNVRGTAAVIDEHEAPPRLGRPARRHVPSRHDAEGRRGRQRFLEGEGRARFDGVRREEHKRSLPLPLLQPLDRIGIRQAGIVRHHEAQRGQGLIGVEQRDGQRRPAS